MGKVEHISPFSYTPRQDGYSDSVVDKYEFYTSTTGNSVSAEEIGFHVKKRERNSSDGEMYDSSLKTNK